MPFNQDALDQARSQGYSDEEIFSHLASSDKRFSVAKQQGYSLDEIATQLTKGGETNEQVQNQPQADQNRNAEREPLQEDQLQAADVGQRNEQGLLPQDQGQRRGNDQADLTGGESIEGQTQDAQGGIQGAQERQGVPSQVPTGNQAEIAQAVKMEQGVQPAAPAKQQVGGLAAFGRGITQSLAATNELLADAVGLFPYLEDKAARAFGIDSNLYNRWKDAVHSTGLGKPGVEAAAIKPTEELTTAGQITQPIGTMVGDLAFILGTGAMGESAAGSKMIAQAEPTIIQAVKDSLPQIQRGLQAMSVPAAKSGVDAIQRSADKGDDTITQMAKGMASAIATDVIGAMPLAAQSKLTNPVLRFLEQGAYGFLTSIPATEFQKQVESWSEGKPYVPSEFKDMVIQAIPMGLMSGVFGIAHAPQNVKIKREIEEAGLPQTAEVVSETMAEEPVAAEASNEPPAEIPAEPLTEIPAEAQPTKPSETEIPETSRVSPVESVAPFAEAAVKAEEGVAPRQGEGEKEVAAPEGARVAAAAYLAPDGKTYEGASHLEAMENAKKAGAITQAEIDAKQTAESRNTEEFGYVVTQPDGTRVTTNREAAGKIAKASGQALKEEFDFGDKMHSNETKLDDFPQAGEVKEPTFMERAESWADQTLADFVKQSRKAGITPGFEGPNAAEVIAAAAVKGAAIIARGAREFGAWSKEMVARYGNAIEPYLSDIWEKSKAYAAGGEKAMEDVLPYLKEGKGPTVMRGMSERIAEQAPESLRYQIEADELVGRKKVSFIEANEFVSSLKDDDVLAEYERIKSMPKSESQGAYKVALGRRASEILQERGDDAASGRIINEISEEGSYAGVVLSAIGNFFATTPKGFLNDVISAAEKKGVKLSEKAKQKTSDLYGSYLEAKKNLELATETMLNIGSEEEFKQELKMLKFWGDKALDAQTAVQKYVGGLMPKDVRTEMYPALQKLGLISTRSSVINYEQNIIKALTIDIPANLISSGGDMLKAMVLGRERTFVYGPQEAAILISTIAKHTPEMAVNIIKAIAGKDLRISNPANSLEVKAAFDPKAAIKRLRNNPEDLEYDYSVKEKVKDFVEATYGRVANVMAGFLIATDRPTRVGAERAAASSIARNLGLKGLEYKKFLEAPEKAIEFFVRRTEKDPAVRAEKIAEYKKRLNDMTAEALMEQEGKAFKALTKFTKLIDDLFATEGGKGAFTSVPPWISTIFNNVVFPFVRYSANFAASVFKLARPEVAAISFVSNVLQKKTYAATRDFGLLGVSITTGVIGYYLYKNGIINASYKPQSKEQDIGQETGDTGGMINFSAMYRHFNGQDSTWRNDDNIQKLTSLGLVGVMMNAQADVQKIMDDARIQDQNANVAWARFVTIPKVMQLALNASTMKGVSDFLSAVSKDQLDGWYKSVFKTLVAVPAPMTLDQISRATRKYTIDVDGENVPSTLYNIINARFGYDEYLPNKYGVWGEPIPQTPKGENPFVYNLINPFNSRTLNYKPATEQMMLLYKQTLDKEVLPSKQDNQITVGRSTYKLDTASKQRVQQLVGQERLKLINNLIDGKYFEGEYGQEVPWVMLTEESKLRKWKRSLDLGNERGKKAFVNEREAKGIAIGKKMLTTPERIENIKALQK